MQDQVLSPMQTNVTGSILTQNSAV